MSFFDDSTFTFGLDITMPVLSALNCSGYHFCWPSTTSPCTELACFPGHPFGNLKVNPLFRYPQHVSASYLPY